MRTPGVRCAPYLGTLIHWIAPPITPYMPKNAKFTAPPSTTTTTITHTSNVLLYNGPPLLQEKLPRPPGTAVANNRVPMLDPTHGALGPPHPLTPFRHSPLPAQPG